ncbi:thioesterase domain-containing protein, partial [Type-E symbiont of Plautia stali]|uniref:thioesterase domain-containing protein n=1 Tax=Type-E symbiont of Plautia stali TaxID=1560357 RepID=UPI000AC2471C
QLDRAAVLQLAQGIEEVSLLAMAQALLSLPQFASARKAPVALTDLVSSGAVASRHERLIGRWLRALTEQGFLQQVDEERFVAQRQVTSHDVEQRWQTLHQLGHKVNWGAAILRYMHDSHLALPALMRNEADPLDLLFPEGQTHVAEAAYRDNLVSRTVNELVCATICQIAREKNGETLRLLEVGAGVGGTSLDLIPALAAFPVDYLFSDLSNYFLNEAEKRFSQWPWVRYGLYDINQPALPQGIEPASRDVILCANVLHNSRHAADVIAKLKEILAPGGWLVFIEATSNSYQIMSSMEFKEGLTGFKDCRLEQGTTFISLNEWHHYLEQAGATEIVIAPQEALALNDLGQHVFAARFKTHQATVHPDELRHHLSQWLPAWMLPDEIHQLDHLPLTSNGKIDRRALASLIPTKRTERSTTAAAPASALEKDIAKIWQSVLKIDSVGRHDNFFTLGGDSLLVAQVVSRLRATLPQASGWRWDTLLRAMMNEKDLAALAQRFSQPQASHYTLQEIQPGEASATTLLLVHDGSGTLAPYRAMLEKIDKRQRVLGLALNTPEQFLAQPAESGIARLAKQAVEVIVQDMNSAPLHIVGYCLGGMLAQEIASLLHATGKEIAQLSIISSYPVPFRIDDDLLAEYIFARVVQADPRALGYPEDEQAFQRLINDILQETPGVIPQGSLAAFSLGKQDAGSQAITALASRSPDTRLEAIRRHCALGDSDLNTPARVAEQFKLIRHSLLAVNGHPLQAYDHPVTFLRQLGEMQVLPGMNTEMTTFWQQHTTLPLHIHDIPGDHFSCLNSKNCHHILNALALSAGEHND